MGKGFFFKVVESQDCVVKGLMAESIAVNSIPSVTTCPVFS